MTLADYSKKITRARAMLDRTHADITNLQSRKSAAQDDLIHLENAQVFIQKAAEQTQSQLKIHITDIVQLAMDTCFPNEYEFAVNFEIKRGQTEANLYFMKNGQPVSPIDASGGGAVDLAAFALRVAAWTLSKTRNTIILDEPFRFLSRELQPKAAAILAALSKRLDLQFILVSHNEAIINEADRIFECQLNNGVTVVEMKTPRSDAGRNAAPPGQ